MRDLDALFRAHHRELQRYLARWIGCRETASDLTQETLLRVAQQPEQRGETNFRAYLYRTAHNLAVDHVRQQKRRLTRTVPPDQLGDVPDDAPSAERAADARYRLDLLNRAIAELPDLTQRIFVLNRIEGFTYLEVARRLGISESSVQKHLAKALYHAMQRLKEV